MSKDTQAPRHPLHDPIHELLDQWRDVYARSPLANLHQFRQLEPTSPTARHQCLRQAITEMLDVLKTYNADQATVLRLRFFEGWSTHKVCRELHMAESALYKAQSFAIEWLAIHLGEREADARRQIERQAAIRLEAQTNSELFGVNSQLVRLVAKLSSNEAPWIISLEGMGGIGKTALANVVMRHMIGLPHYADFAWVTARRNALALDGSFQSHAQPSLTTNALVDHLVAQLSNQHRGLITLPPDQKRNWLRYQLKEEPHLITVDNLETVVDLETLLPLLQELCNPTRFLLTSRLGLDHYNHIVSTQVLPLAESDALRLIRYEADQRQFPEILQASESQLQTIYETVGGNPLALRLAVGKLAIDTLDNVLNDLKQAHGTTVENLYTYIFHSAYRKISPNQRRVWMAVSLLLGPVATVEMLSKSTQLAAQEVRQALENLIRMNLVDVRGTLEQRSYALHPLTHTFLENQFGRWETGGDNYSV